MRKIKILFLIRSLRTGGAERQLVELVKNLNKDRFDVAVLTFYKGGQLQEELKENDIKVIPLEKKSRWDLFNFWLKLIKVVKKYKPDIIHGYTDVPNIFSLILGKFIHPSKVVWGIRCSNMDEVYNSKLNKVIFKIAGKMSKFADLIIVNSESGYKYHIDKGYKQEKMIVVHNGIDTSRFNIKINKRRKMREELNINEEKILIGMIGRLDPVKNHKVFINSMANIKRELPNSLFVIIGDGPEWYKTDLYELAKKNEVTQDILWLGNRIDMPDVINSLDLVVSTSISEGFSNVIAESMACGIPCVVSNVGDSSIIIGDTGETLSSLDQDIITATVCKKAKEIIANKEKSRINARNRIVGNFSTEVLISKTESILLKLER